MYWDNRTKVKYTEGLTNDFQVTVGNCRAPSGISTQPTPVCHCKELLDMRHTRDVPWDMSFVDNMVLCGESQEDLETRLEIWIRAIEDRGMRASRQKTEYLCIREGEMDEEVQMQRDKLKQVEEFKYLGSTVQMDEGTGREVQKRIQSRWGAWRKIMRLPYNRRVPSKLKGRLYKMMVRLVMLYGMEMVTVTKRQRAKWRWEK